MCKETIFSPALQSLFLGILYLCNKPDSPKAGHHQVSAGQEFMSAENMFWQSFLCEKI